MLRGCVCVGGGGNDSHINTARPNNGLRKASLKLTLAVHYTCTQIQHVS